MDRRALLWIPLLVLASACSAGAGRYALPDEAARARQQPIDPDAPRIVRGRPSAFLDGLNHYVLSLPTKLLLWDWQVLDHRLRRRARRCCATTWP